MNLPFPDISFCGSREAPVSFALTLESMGTASDDAKRQLANRKISYTHENKKLRTLTNHKKQF